MLVTTAARVPRMCPLPVVPRVRYIVCIQDPDFGLNPLSLQPLQRPDIDVRIYHDRGVSANRNHALEAATADVLMVGDDDLIYHPEGLEALLGFFENNPRIDWITTHAEVDSSRVYPPDGWNHARTFRFYASITFEMAFRRTSLPPGLRFSTLAGIGAPYLGAGEEDLFYHHLRKAGLRGQFVDLKVVSHPHPSTDIHSASNPRFVRAKGALMWVMRGPAGALIRLPLEAKRSELPFFNAFRELFKGMMYAAKNRRYL